MRELNKLYLNCEETSKCIIAVGKSELIRKRVDELAKQIVNTDRKGKIVAIFGNGGSAADAQHFAAELVCTYEDKNREGIKALAITANTSIITAWANDNDFESIFARQVETFRDTVGICIGLSTSGNSANVLDGLRKAKDAGHQTWLIRGESNKEASEHNEIIIPSKRTSTIQTATQVIYHTICELIENMEAQEYKVEQKT